MESRIKIDLDRRIGGIDPNIYGGFIEHLGRCIYGGVYEEGSSLSDADGFRLDVLESLRALRMPLLRWPGGNFVSGYHWVDGIGPPEQRPRRLELAWSAEESNRFGTDEFIRYCRRLGAEPFIVVNMGTGSMDEAQSWVEYCNGTGNTYWANLRRRHGHDEPYRVKYWGLGNEMYGDWQIGALTAEDYVKRATQFAKVMKWTDPCIQLVSCGEFGWGAWDRIVLEGLAPFVDYHSIHLYTGADDYYSRVLTPHQAERALRYTQATIDQVRYNQQVAHPIRVAYDEWNTVYSAGYETPFTLADAIAVATYLNVFIRHCRTVGLATISMPVNVGGAIFTSPEGMVRQTTYHPLRLYAEHMRGIALDPYVECDVHDLAGAEDTAILRGRAVADLGPFPLLDVAASRDPDGRALVIAIVNRAHDRDLPTTIQLVDAVARPDGVAYEINGPHVDARNTFDAPETVGVAERRLEIAGSQFAYTFPAHSITLLRLALASPDP